MPGPDRAGAARVEPQPPTLQPAAAPQLVAPAAAQDLGPPPAQRPDALKPSREDPSRGSGAARIRINPGHHHTVIGPNRCGKTKLVRAWVRPLASRIIIDPRNVGDYSEP